MADLRDCHFSNSIFTFNGSIIQCVFDINMNYRRFKNEKFQIFTSYLFFLTTHLRAIHCISNQLIARSRKIAIQSLPSTKVF